MSIWNKILVGFIFVASVAFFYMAMRTLKTHQYWRESVQKHEKKIQEVEDENYKLVEGDEEVEDAELGIKQLRFELHKLMIDRGRVWYRCKPAQANPQTGQVAVTTDLPIPHKITAKTVLYVFEEADVDQGNPAQSGHYLGEFKVTDVGETQVQLAPAMKMDDEELQLMAASRGPWTLYEKMPIDNHEIFADLDEAELEKLLPKENLPEYVNDGQMLTSEEAVDLGLEGTVVEVDENGKVVYVDENGSVVQVSEVGEDGAVTYTDESGKEVNPTEIMEKLAENGKGMYRRPLRDYKVLLRDNHLQRSLMVDRLEAAQRNLQYMVVAGDDADVQVRFRQQEKTELKGRLAEAIRQHRASTDHQQVLQQEIEARRLAVARMIAGNQATAGQIARIQLDAAQKIDARTPRMAQSGVQGN